MGLFPTNGQTVLWPFFIKVLIVNIYYTPKIVVVKVAL